MKTLLFFHGGPGLNGNPEQQILANSYRNKVIDFKAWNEPSSLRNTFDTNFAGTRFEQLLDSAEKFLLENYNGKQLYLMGHSMGCQTVLALLQKHNDKIKSIFMVSPCFNIHEADKKIFTVIQKDYAKYGDEIASKNMGEIISSMAENSNDNIIQGWKIALENPRILDYYWVNKACQANYFSHFVNPKFSMDMESFFEARKAFTDIKLFPSDKRIIIFYSEKDPVTDIRKENTAIAKYFSDLLMVNMEKSSHYPHIEEQDKVLAIISGEIG